MSSAERKRRSRERLAAGLAKTTTIAQLADAMSVSPSQIYLAKRVLREGLPEWHRIIMAGDVALSMVIDIIEHGRVVEQAMIFAFDRFGPAESRRIWSDSAREGGVETDG